MGTTAQVANPCFIDFTDTKCQLFTTKQYWFCTLYCSYCLNTHNCLELNSGRACSHIPNCHFYCNLLSLSSGSAGFPCTYSWWLWRNPDLPFSSPASGRHTLSQLDHPGHKQDDEDDNEGNLTVTTPGSSPPLSLGSSLPRLLLQHTITTWKRSSSYLNST